MWLANDIPEEKWLSVLASSRDEAIMLINSLLCYSSMLQSKSNYALDDPYYAQ